MGKKILVIEDESWINKMIVTRLKANGYELTSVRDGDEGIRKLEKESFDLVVTDHRMERVTGAEVITYIRENKKLKNTPVIILSAHIPTDVQEQLKYKADAYVPKPFTAEDLLATVKMLLKE